MTDQQPSAEIQRKMDTPIDQAPLTFKMVQQISGTEMVPQQYRGRPAAIVAAILTGREFGLQPFEAMRGIDVIDGKPNLSAELILRLLREKGHRVKVLEESPEKVRLLGIRAEDPDDQMEASFTWDEASRVVTKWKYEGSGRDRRKAKDKDGRPIPLAVLTDKDNWRNYPTDMLFWRALTRLARRQFPDAIGATRMLYTSEELDPSLEEAPAGWDLPGDEPVVDDDGEPVEAELVEDAEFGERVEEPEDDDAEDAEIVADATEASESVENPEDDDAPPFTPSTPETEADVEDGTPETDESDAAPPAGDDFDPYSEDQMIAWDSINKVTGMPQPLEGAMPKVQDRVRRLCAAMETTRLWPDPAWGEKAKPREDEDVLHYLLRTMHRARHLGDLRRDELDTFTTTVIDQAKATIERHEASRPAGFFDKVEVE